MKRFSSKKIVSILNDNPYGITFEFEHFQKSLTRDDPFTISWFKAYDLDRKATTYAPSYYKDRNGYYFGYEDNVYMANDNPNILNYVKDEYWRMQFFDLNKYFNYKFIDYIESLDKE